jgi:hypothetical protein
MTRTELVEPIADYAGPLGPFRTPEEREQQFRQWLSGARFDWLEPLLDLLLNPPVEASHSFGKDGWHVALVECLAHVGKLDPQRFHARVAPLLVREEIRLPVICALEEIGGQESAKVLRVLYDTGTLSDEEISYLAGALGEIGGQEARETLLRMHMAIPVQKQNIHREMDNALKGC